MILPQSRTFNVLKTRLDCVNITNFSLPFVGEKDPQSYEVKKEKEANKKFVVDCLK